MMQKNKNVDIFIYAHIPFRPVAIDPVYKVLTHSDAPDEKFQTNLEIYRDYTGENIADKNLMYNEYTGFYWLWNNYDLKDYVGMNHYRRMYDCYNNLPDFNAIFKKKSIVLNNPIQLRVHDGLPRGGEYLSNRDWYEYWHNIDDFNLLGEIINDLYPEYSDGFERMANTKYLYGCSMFVMRKKTFIKYCEYIFDVLEEFNERMNCFSDQDYIKHVENNKDKYIKPGLTYYDVRMQSRIVGYAAERALNAFLMSGGKKSLESNAEILTWSMIPEETYKVD